MTQIRVHAEPKKYPTAPAQETRAAESPAPPRNAAQTRAQAKTQPSKAHLRPQF